MTRARGGTLRAWVAHARPTAEAGVRVRQDRRMRGMMRSMTRSTASPRLGVVDYANVAPLTRGLARDGEALLRAVPSRLADLLAAGELDVAMVPAIELGRLPGARLVLPWGIGADGECRSVFLFSKGPLEEVRVVGLDASSRTSAALTRIVLARAGARVAEWRELSEGSLEERLRRCDAALLIGDPALKAECPAGVAALDLAAEWKRLTGLPFVFAGWIARPGYAPDSALRARLDAAAERGLAEVPAIAAAEARRIGVSDQTLREYYGVLDYRLGAAHLRGLERFLDEAWSLGLVPARPHLEVA